MEKLVEHSQIHRKNVITIGAILAFLFGMAGLGIYLWVTRHYIDPYKLFTALSLAAWVIWRASSKYTYEVDKKVFRLTKKTAFGKETTIEIPYRDIIGIYDYKPQLMSILKYRRTMRMNSALDGRHIWTIAYTVPGKKKPENRRIYFKPSETMLDALHTKMPSKVKVDESQMSIEQLKKEDLAEVNKKTDSAD